MQPTTERMTRARARTLAATGQTPSLAALTDKTPATTRTTRRRAAAAAAAPAETEGAVAPVVLFDVTNEQTGSPAQQPLTARDAPAAAQAAAAAAAPAAEPLAAVIEEAPAEPATAPTAAQEEPVLPASPAPAAAAADEEPAVPASPAPAAAAEEAAAGEPPATPATAPTSPAPPVPGATPTGLGLSTLLPLSPSPPLAFQVQAATPAATPLAGLHEDHQAKVADALAAAVEALGGASPAAAASPAPAAGQGGEPMFRGFGSPLKQEEGDSPALLPPMPAASSGPSVSIGAAIGAADMLMADDAMSSPAPEVGLEAAFERELTLEEMMGTPPGASDRDDTPAAAAAAAPAATPGVRVRTAAKAHPLTPARQVVLEEEQEDYIMQTEEDTEAGAVGPAAVPSPAPTPFPAPAAQPSPAPSTAPGLSPAVLYLAPSAAASPAPAPAVAAAVPTPSPTAQPSPTPEAAAAAEAAAQAQPRIGSKVVLPSPGVYDPRSLRQLKREVADRLAAKQAAVPHPFADDEDEDGDGEYIGTPSGDDLADELGALSLEGGNKLLRGLPTPAGTHIRFDDEGDVAAVSPRQRVYLRGSMVAAVKPPAYQEFHESASVLVGRFRNEGALASLPPKTHFAWMHRFYLILDEVATQHKVFKLYGGPQGFLLATNVAEPDADHAITLLTCALKLLNRAEHIRVPGGAPLDLTLALDSGPLASGLLGSTSLTYQVVGRSLAVAEELAEHETQVPFLVADGMHRFLPAAAAAGLIPLGAVQLRCSRDEAVPVYTLPQYNGLPLDHAAPAALGIPMRLPDHAPVTAESALGAPTPLASDQGDSLASLSLRSDSQGDGSAPNSNKGAAVPAA